MVLQIGNPLLSSIILLLEPLIWGATDKAALDSNSKKAKNNKTPRGLTPEQLLFYNKYHKERNNIEE